MIPTEAYPFVSPSPYLDNRVVVVVVVVGLTTLLISTSDRSCLRAPYDDGDGAANNNERLPIVDVVFDVVVIDVVASATPTHITIHSIVFIVNDIIARMDTAAVVVDDRRVRRIYITNASADRPIGRSSLVGRPRRGGVASSRACRARGWT
jgi:hypothetical protein